MTFCSTFFVIVLSSDFEIKLYMRMYPYYLTKVREPMIYFQYLFVTYKNFFVGYFLPQFEFYGFGIL